MDLITRGQVIGNVSPNINSKHFISPQRQTIGENIAVNGDFAADTDWLKGAGWTIAAGVAACDGTQIALSELVNTGSIDAIPGETYRVTFTVVARTFGGVALRIGAGLATSRILAGTYTEDVTAINSDKITALATIDFVGSIDNVIVRKLL